jgi:hypothetical protein
MIKNFLLVFSFLLSFEIMAQDRIVTINGDTLIGKVKIISNASKIPYSIIRTEEDKITVDFLKTKSIEILDQGTFKPLKVNANYVFALQVTEGYLNWYKYSHPEQGEEYGSDLLQKLDGETLEVGGIIGFRRSISGFLKDCEILVEKIEKKELGRNDLAMIVEEYNVFINKKNEELFASTTELTKNKIKIDLFVQFENQLKESTQIKDKTSALQILKDFKEKLISSELIPEYLSEALKAQIQNDETLLKLLNEILN